MKGVNLNKTCKILSITAISAQSNWSKGSAKNTSEIRKQVGAKIPPSAMTSWGDRVLLVILEQ